MASESAGFAGQSGIITGAANGIGRATAVAIAKQGGRVLAIDRDEAGLKSLADEADAAIKVAVHDLGEETAHDAYVATARDEFGAVNFFFNNAGVEGPRKPVSEITTEEWDATVAINLRSAFQALRAVVPAMRPTGGQILNVSSCLGVMGAPGASAYVATKHAIIGLTKSLAAEEARNGISVNCIAPGPVDTDLHNRAADRMDTGEDGQGHDALDSVRAMIPLDRFGSPQEIADLACFLLEPGRGFLTGSVISIDGGMTAALYRRGS